MEKYKKLLDDVAEELKRKTDQGIVFAVDLERIERLLIAAERQIKTTEKAG